MTKSDLRPAIRQDASVLAGIHMRSRAAAMPWLPVLHTADETLVWMTDTVLPNQNVWIAERDGIVLGYVALVAGWIDQLYVDPSAWRAGAGSALLKHVKESLPGGFNLWTFERNSMARAFYEKYGLIEIRRSNGRDNEEKEPDILLGWKLIG